MVQFAQVIVDVPTLQTNRPYDYVIPAIWQAQLRAGMRVVVPFGKGQRQIQGFVVGITDTAPDYTGELKAITQVLDLQPVLNPELLALAKWLAQWTFAFQISCMQTMLPSVMKASYSKKVRLLGAPTPATTTIFHDQTELDFADLAPETIKQLLKLQQEQLVEVVYQVHDRAKVKTIKAIKPLLAAADYTAIAGQVPANAKRQHELLTYLAAHTTVQEPITLQQVTTETQLTLTHVQTGAAKGWLRLIELETYRDPYAELASAPRTQPLTLTKEQANAVHQITTAGQQQHDQVFLVEGVTGSGKTEIYLQSIQAALNSGRTALMLVPEIGLTPQMVARVRGRFGAHVAVLHSGLSNGERYDEWRRIERGEAQVVVGARSAIFAPLTNIGLIIMDEEHEGSYKQDEMPRYHARDVALWRAKYHHCPVVLGSATPSLESRARAQKGVYQLIRLKERANHQPLPEVTVVDMKNELKKTKEDNFSGLLMQELRKRVLHKEQSVLMLNRRGFSSFVMCRDCGFVLKCPNCDISLTLHMDTHSMKCHYCGHEEAIPQVCPNCQSRKIRYYGTGTQKVESELQGLLPEARILRMDVDTTRRKGAHAKILRQFGRHEADILLGTQMIAKGLDFPDVTLVGVLNADTALGLPDFRASERTFQLLTQVSGRAGRAEKKGEVIVQTYNPEHYAIRLARHHDYEGFYQREMTLRHQGGYPPYYYTILVTASHEEENEAAKKIFQLMNQVKPVLSPQAVLLGPTPRAIARVNKRYYYQMVIKYKHEPQLQKLLTQIMQENQARNGIQISIDREPLSFI
ncbi:primosomal protein N' [Loigolactobacillus coryniformis]|uniref:Replication restart protein PriA n=1 Tax=Loigolactobacillus coryniformis subsp. torquens DSM 20004 = KCTC 3535 TaxID=1423822 RepID=A0A2D1KPA4_9LACO|nr:primosomal protein N' [Loigolactobacillus coryniformis]ATO43984.1 primosomal protein N' [Loigolactobacillus coryniformis subsp. torquens DSM 20004 = KCTC 3535]KRK84404.1 primosomal replication protein N (factor Y) [Loigolactobacillus coryniformis subsp. torquens DSM 20004 = KCTC 3535]